MQAMLTGLFSFEALAVVLAIAYLLLAARESLWCWYCAFISSLIYVVIFWDVSLLMDSVLNVFYVVMAVVGWQQWRRGGVDHHGVQIISLRWQQHLQLFAAMLVVSLLSGWLMGKYTREAWPFLDSFTTWASVVTTVLVVRKVLENWLYWLLIDSISCYLYIDRGLYLTAILFAAYLVIVIFGYLHWRRIYNTVRLI